MELELKDLRIGNYVKINNKVLYMDTRLFYAVIEGFEGYKPKPIPLTDEWLDKLGVEKNDKGQYSFQYNRFVIVKVYDSYAVLLNLIEDLPNSLELITHFKYLHELQNLVFWLTREELTLKS